MLHKTRKKDVRFKIFTVVKIQVEVFWCHNQEDLNLKKEY